MTFEFHGVNLETAEGLSVYKAVFQHVAGTTAEASYYEADYQGWAEASPTEAATFLSSLATDESPHLRGLAAKLARYDFMRACPDLSLEVMTSAMLDENPAVHGDLVKVVRESVDNGEFDEWLGKVGLRGVHRLFQAAHQAGGD